MRSKSRAASALIAAAVVVAAATDAIWRIHSSAHPVDTATVIAGYVAVGGFAVTLLSALGRWWWKGRGAKLQVGTSAQVALAADRLAVLMEDRWRREAATRRIVTPAPVTVRWQWAKLASSLPEVSAPPAPGTGPRSLPEFVQGLSRQPRKRRKRPPQTPGVTRTSPNTNRECTTETSGQLLDSGVVTSLHDDLYALLPHGRLVLLGGPGAGKTGTMILLLLAALDCRSSAAADAERARIPVPVWLTLGGWDPASTSLHEWAVGMMNRDHRALRARAFGPDAAGELLRQGRVALFLDGLDEMPPGIRAKALKRIDEEARHLRIVLTSRRQEYRRSIQRGRLSNTAVIELLPVQPAEAAAYLQRDQGGLQLRYWEVIGAYITQHQGSVVARALNNPLTLTLARDAYESRDPTPLSDPTSFPNVNSVREHLIEQFLISVYPDKAQRQRAVEWLSWIAHNMGDSRDLSWWKIRTWVPRWPLRVTCLFTEMLVFGVTLGLALTFGIISVNDATVLTVVYFLVSLIPSLRKDRVAVSAWEKPMSLFLRRPRLPEIIQLLVFAVVLWWGISIHNWLVILLDSLLLARPTFKTFEFAPTADQPSATAGGTYRADRRSAIVAVLAAIPVTGFFFGLFFSAFGPGLVGGLTLATVIGTWFESWLLKLTEVVLLCQRRGVISFSVLLENALAKQVFRQAGAVYQFRHASIQHSLSRRFSELHSIRQTMSLERRLQVDTRMSGGVGIYTVCCGAV